MEGFTGWRYIMLRHFVSSITKSKSLRVFNMYKFIVIAATLAVANAGYLGAPAVGYAAAPVGYAASPYGYASHVTPAITSQSQNILRSYGNLGQVSTYSKTIDTPYSSVSKSDVRVSNPGYATVAHAPVAYAAPVAHAPVAYAAPAYAARAVAAPVAHAGLLGVAYSAAPAVSHMTYTNSYGIQYGW